MSSKLLSGLKAGDVVVCVWPKNPETTGSAFHFLNGWYGKVLVDQADYGTPVIDFGVFAKVNEGYDLPNRIRTTDPKNWEPEVKAMNPTDGTWRVSTTYVLEKLDDLRAAYVELKCTGEITP